MDRGQWYLHVSNEWLSSSDRTVNTRSTITPVRGKGREERGGERRKGRAGKRGEREEGEGRKRGREEEGKSGKERREGRGGGRKEGERGGREEVKIHV